MAVDFAAIKALIDQLKVKLDATSKLIDEAAIAKWLSPTMGQRNYSEADLADLKASYDTLKAEMQALFLQLP